MTTASQPLLTLPEARVQEECRRATDLAAAHSDYRRRTARLALVCLGEYGVGLGTIGLSYHIYGGDMAAVALYAGLLVGLCGPVWTVLLSMWLEENR